MSVNSQFSGLAYVGRSTLRHDSEPTSTDFESQDEYENIHPECRPHIFVRYHSITLGDALMNPSDIVKGSSGVIVQYQKLVRDKATEAEANAWRESFTPDMIESVDVVNLTKENIDDVKFDVVNGAPFVILDADDVNLDVPKQVADMKEDINMILNKMGVDKDLDEHSDAEIREMYEALQ